jgi:hypothetical protein
LGLNKAFPLQLHPEQDAGECTRTLEQQQSEHRLAGSSTGLCALTYAYQLTLYAYYVHPFCITNYQAGQLQPCQQQWHHRPSALQLVTLPAQSRHAATVLNSSKQRHACRVHASAWGVPEPFAAPQLQQPSLSSIAEMQRQVDREMDSFLSPFSSMHQMEARMDEQFREFDRQFDRAFADVDRAQRQLDAELARSMRQLQQQEPGVRIERREERAPGSYRCANLLFVMSLLTSRLASFLQTVWLHCKLRSSSAVGCSSSECRT